jgi:Zn-dependent protease with chaperone function
MEDIKKLSRDVRLRIVCFILFYIALIAVGAALLYAAVLYTPRLFELVMYLSENYSRRVAGFVGVLIPVFWIVLILMAIYMVKPIFKFTRNKKAGRIEVRERQCPRLFQVIRDVATATGCPMPKHVYLSADVNACVFYNTSFWSIFFPVRKNLEIGLGLFHRMSEDEIKSIIAHEFGHFSQKSMKVGSAVYVANTVIYNLVNGEDAVDRWMARLKHARFNLFALAGDLFASITGWIRSLVVIVYRFIQVKYLRLSRTMEFDADRVACQCIGSDVFISALSKLELLAEGEAFYHGRLRSLADDKKRIADYLATYEASTDMMFSINKIELTFDRPALFNEPPDYTRVSIGDVWQTHPSTPDRIAHARGQEGTPPRTAPQNAWVLIPDDIRRQVSTCAARAYYEADWDELTELSPEAYRQWLPLDSKLTYIPIAVQPYFDRQLLAFDLAAVDLQPVPSPVTEEHTIVLKQFIGALNDQHTLLAIQAKEIVAPTYYYNGKPFKRKETPETRHRQYLDGLREEARAIDIQMYRYLMNHAADPEALRANYVRTFYALATYANGLSSLPELRAEVLGMYERYNEFTDKQFRHVTGLINDCETTLLQVVRRMKTEYLAPVAPADVLKGIADWAAEPHPAAVGTIKKGRYKGQPQVNADAVNRMFELIDVVDRVHSLLLYRNSTRIYHVFYGIHYGEEVAAEEAVA